MELKTTQPSKLPTPDHAEHNAFFPSAFSLSQFTSSKSDLSGADYAKPYRGKHKILLIAADERYLPTDTGALFSTGNHPVETLLPMYHLHQAGFEFEVATVSGLMVKFEHWAMPNEDEAIVGLYNHYLPQFMRPRKLQDVVSQLTPDSEYAGVFIPGGHGALIGLPASEAVAETLRWALANDRYVISLCHGPAAFLALSHGANPLQGYAICAFPDAADKQTPDIGYMPGQLTWFFGEQLQKMGLTLMNQDITGMVHKDRKVLTGDSPFAANALGKLAAEELLKAYVG
ncbi:protein deglycase HchA [Plesiomonas shigelloides]|uniref:glyoxalase III HchA n=1 Tax=Plesiomonas shigelloides TaxID=703 RepID=UPI00351D27BC